MPKLIDETKTTKAKKEKPGKVAKPAAAKPLAPTRKPDIVLSLLSRNKGANITQLQEATGWQAHSIRAVISGLRKKGINVIRSQAKDGTTLYRVEKA
jgi:hypothetical protein